MPYPTPPGKRIAYDLNGTLGFISRTAGSDLTPFQLAPAALSALNADSNPPLLIPCKVVNAYYLNPDPVSDVYKDDTVGYWFLSGGDIIKTKDQIPNWLMLLFPEPMDIQGVWVHSLLTDIEVGSIYTNLYAMDLPFVVQTSQDTTNGADGTWDTIFTSLTSMSPWVRNLPSYGSPPIPMPSPVLPDGSSGILTVDDGVVVSDYFRREGASEQYGWVPVFGAAASNVLAMRLRFEQVPLHYQTARVFLGLHLYGEPSSGATTKRLVFVSETGADIDFDWGDVELGSSEVTSFRVKNLSPTQTASAIELSVAASNRSGTPAPHLMLTLSDDGVTWSNILTLSELAPESSSPVLQMKLVTPDSGILGPWGPRLVAEVGEWI